MLFNSYIFIFLFLPITLFGYFLFNHFKLNVLSKIWLILASLFFYGYFNVSYLWIIISSVFFNFAISKLFNTTFLNNQYILKKILFVLGLTVNISLLFFYKYLDFIFKCTNELFGTDIVYLNLVLPLGISFFTFQQVSYLIDSFRGKVPACSIVDYALFITFLLGYFISFMYLLVSIPHSLLNVLLSVFSLVPPYHDLYPYFSILSCIFSLVK